MKTLILAIFLTMFALSVYAQESPEPTGAGLSYAYRMEICWGTLTANSVWKQISYSSSVVSGSVSGTHNYNGKLGLQTWEADVTIDPLNPQKLILTFDITASMLPQDTFFYHFYRMRIISWLVNTAGEIVSAETISPVGNWVVIYTVKSTGKPIRK